MFLAPNLLLRRVVAQHRAASALDEQRSQQVVLASEADATGAADGGRAPRPAAGAVGDGSRCTNPTLGTWARCRPAYRGRQVNLILTGRRPCPRTIPQSRGCDPLHEVVAETNTLKD